MNKNNKTVTVSCYIDNLIYNEDGINDKLENCYLTVPVEWATKQVNKQGYKTLEEFLNEYTYDDTNGWIDLASREGALLEVGI